MLETHRRQQRETYQEFVLAIECEILRSGSRDERICYGLKERYMTFTNRMYSHGIKSANTTPDARLPDLAQIAKLNLCGFGDKDIDSSKCRSSCVSCRTNLKTVVTEAIKILTEGTEGRMGLCHGCFMGGTSVLQNDCKKHCVAAETTVGSQA